MLICDEYIALRALALGRPSEMPADEPLAMTSSTWWRLLRPVHTVLHSRLTSTTPTNAGSLSDLMSNFEDDDLELIRDPQQYAITVLDSRRLLDTAAQLGLNHTGGLLQLELLAAAVVHDADLWFGRRRNLSSPLANAAEALGISVHVLSDAIE